MGLDTVQKAFVDKYLRATARGPSDQSYRQSETRDGTVDLQKLRLAWDSSRKIAAAELKKLEKEIVQAFSSAPDAAEMARVAGNMHQALDRLDSRLLDMLDEALNAQTPEERRRLQAKARKETERYVKVIQSDPVLQIVEDNPFTRVNVSTGLLKSLTALQNQL